MFQVTWAANSRYPRKSLCALTQTSHYDVLIATIRSLSLEKSKQVTGHVFAETTRVVTEPHGYASVVMLATQLCMLCDVEICTGVLDPQGSKVAPFQYFGWLLHKPIQNDDNDDDDDDDDETNDKLLLRRLGLKYSVVTTYTKAAYSHLWQICSLLTRLST